MYGHEKAAYPKWIDGADIRFLYKHYLMGEIDPNTYKAKNVACNELLFKTKNYYNTSLAQAKQRQDERPQQCSRKWAQGDFRCGHANRPAKPLIAWMLVYPDRRIEIAYRIRDIFD